MIGPFRTDTLANAVISGVAHQGFSVATRDGRPAQLAVLDENGNVLDVGPAVMREAWNVMLQVHRNWLQGNGHLIVHTSPTGIVTVPKKGRAAG